MPRFRWPYALLTLAYCGMIFFLSAQPNLPQRGPAWLDWPGSDKLIHGLVYGGLAWVVRLGLSRSNPVPGYGVRVLGPVVFAVVYGMSDEFHQRFVPNRSFELLDLLADAVGATIVIAIVEIWSRRTGSAD